MEGESEERARRLYAVQKFITSTSYLPFQHMYPFLEVYTFSHAAEFGFSKSLQVTGHMQGSKVTCIHSSVVNYPANLDLAVELLYSAAMYQNTVGEVRHKVPQVHLNLTQNSS